MTPANNAPPGAPAGVLADVHDSPNGERVTSDHAPPQKASPDWGYEQSKLRGHWVSLTDEDFVGLDGNRDRFLDRLSSREQISRDRAALDLDAFESGKAVKWQTGSAGTLASTDSSAP